MTAIPREQAEVHIRDVLTEFINMAQGVKDSGITVNANGKRILDGLETAKKALVKLEENYFAQLSDGGIQTFLDKCKILARQFELEQSKKIQFLNVYKDGICITIRAQHKDYDAENRRLVLYKNNEDIVFECSELPGFYDGSKERNVVWGVQKMINGIFQYIDDLNTLHSIIYARGTICIIRSPEAGIYKVTADFIEYTKGEWDIRKRQYKWLEQQEIDVTVLPQQSIKEAFSIVITRSNLDRGYINDGYGNLRTVNGDKNKPINRVYYKSLLELRYLRNCIFSCPVQSTGDHSFDQTTLPKGIYTGYLLVASGSYKNAIQLVNDELHITSKTAFLIHPNCQTNLDKTEPYGYKPGSKGCQILELENFNRLVQYLKQFGFEFNVPGIGKTNGDTIKVVIQ